MGKMDDPMYFMTFYADVAMQTEDEKIQDYFVSPEYFQLSEVLSSFIQTRREQGDSVVLRQFIKERDIEMFKTLNSALQEFWSFYYKIEQEKPWNQEPVNNPE